jgi:hypothetical protein
MSMTIRLPSTQYGIAAIIGGVYGELLHRHLTCRGVDEPNPIVQAPTIEGLMMGEA